MTNSWQIKLFRVLRAIRILSLSVALLLLGARLTFHPDPHDRIRLGDRLFASGQYHAAFAFYKASANATANPQLLLRIGMLETVRGEVTDANRTFAHALHQGLAGSEYDLLRLYQGRAALLNGQRDDAFNLWQTVVAPSPFLPYRQVLEAEAQLTGGDYAAAETSYQAGLSGKLQAAWQQFVVTRLAMLRATSDQERAVALLRSILPATSTEPDPMLLRPLLPQARPSATQLTAALQAPRSERTMQLGQLYLDAGFYDLAEAQFALGPNAPTARAYAAYTRLRAGDHSGAISQLEGLVAAQPNDARTRTLLALAYLEQRDTIRAKAQLEALRRIAPTAAETEITWGQWYSAQSDYTAAATAYRRALAAAPLDQRGTYLLVFARFQLDATLRVCEDGKPAAEEAVHLLDTIPAWLTLAETRLTCSDYPGAQAAAEQVLKRDPSNAEAAFYRGQALALLGQRETARQALIAAADLAPASDWRIKAERSLGSFGL